MIRFKTIDPAEAEKPAGKPQVKPAAAPVPAEAPEAEADAALDKPKGLTRKAPLRAKKPAASGLFRD
jgi:hypothetical protein